MQFDGVRLCPRGRADWIRKPPSAGPYTLRVGSETERPRPPSALKVLIAGFISTTLHLAFPTVFGGETLPHVVLPPLGQNELREGPDGEEVGWQWVTVS
jgi:hypothetical protein